MRRQQRRTRSRQEPLHTWLETGRGAVERQASQATCIVTALHPTKSLPHGPLSSSEEGGSLAYGWAGHWNFLNHECHRQPSPAIPAGCCVFELPHVVWTAGKASPKVGATLPRFKIGIGIV